MSIARLDDFQRFDPARLVKAPIVDSPRFFCDVYCLEPGQEQAVHAHADAEKIYVVLDGEATITLGGDAHRAAAGVIAHAPAGLPHGVRNDSAARLRLLVFMAPRPHH